MENPSSRTPPGASPAPEVGRPPAAGKRAWGLFAPRTLVLPTWRGWLVLGTVSILLITCFGRALHPFLAMNTPITDGLLVVEGWAPDYAMSVAVAEFKRDHYEKIYVTGGPIEYGSHLIAHKTYAELGAATLVKLGLDSNLVQAVPAPKVRQDRTYNAALELKRWWLAHGIQPRRIHLISEGPHCRRSRLLYSKAMGGDVFIGVTSVPSTDYDEEHWWRYSSGVRNVIGEGLAYLYARLVFSPPKHADHR